MEPRSLGAELLLLEQLMNAPLAVSKSADKKVAFLANDRSITGPPIAFVIVESAAPPFPAPFCTENLLWLNVRVPHFVCATMK